MAILKFYNDITNEEDKQMYKWFMGIDTICYKDIDEFLSSIPENDNSIDLKLHCKGGSVMEGWAMYDKLRASGKEISSIIEGACASMASVLLLAAPIERRKGYKNAKLCIHNPYIDGMMINEPLTADRLLSLANDLKQEQDKILNLYVERTGQDREVLQALMNEDKYIDMEKAKELGFISEIIQPISAKKSDSPNNNFMSKEKKVEIKQSFLDKLLAKAGYKKIEDVSLNLELTTASGEVLTIEREEGDPQVGDNASPDGTFVMPDGSTIIVLNGVITEINEPVEEEVVVEVEELKQEVERQNNEIETLKEEVEELKTQAKTRKENEILAAVKAAGGEAWLAKQCSHYRPKRGSFSSSQDRKKSDEVEARESKTERLLREKKEKRNKKYNN